MICYLYNEPSLLFFINDAPDLLYYSHIPATILALLVGIFVLLNSKNNLLNKLLFFLALSFSVWTTANLILWTNIHVDILLFTWPFLAVSSSLISILSIYFIYVFINKQDVSSKLKLSFLSLLLPVLLFAHTNLNVSGFNITDCDAFGFEGIYYKAYYIALGILALIWIPIIVVRSYIKSTDLQFKKQLRLIGVGIQSFLLSFFTATSVASYLAGIGYFEDSSLEFYGLFGMIIFMIFIGIIIVNFKTFKVGLLATQALTVALLILTASQYTYATTKITVILTTISLLFTALIGYLLIKSVKSEVEQRKKIQVLANDLEKANERLRQMDKLKSEFVSIASHQLRSPITAISGYASLINEGSYGEVPDKMRDPISRIVESARMMASSIEDYLNVSRIEAGNMKFTYSDFNLVDETEHICDDLRPEALQRGLVLLFRKRIDSKGIVNADIGKVQQIIHNLINNSIKYTPKGAITVYVHDDIKIKKLYIDIMDTGIGMNSETLHSIFQKFERGDSANSVNVKGTGLGLYVALKMAEAMKGTISAHSEGEGKGSRFTIELPLAL